MGIEKLGQLNGLNPTELKSGKRSGNRIVESISSVLEKVNAGILAFSPDQTIPVKNYAALVDSGLAQLQPASSLALQLHLGAESGEKANIDEVAERLSITRTEAQQLVEEAFFLLSRIHGAKFIQIGKELAQACRESGVRYEQISDAAHPPQFSPRFYLGLLQRMFPGLSHSVAESEPQSENRIFKLAEEESSSVLRQRLFGE
jgi:hypothetical protein